jgi:hypothetical protein
MSINICGDMAMTGCLCDDLCGTNVKLMLGRMLINTKYR